MSVKERIFGILDPGDEDSKYFDPFIMVLIVLNVIAVILETVDSINDQFHVLFSAFETFSVAVFTVEYLLRVWSCTVQPEYRDPVTGRLRFVVTPFAMIDLMAIFPFYAPFLLPDLRFMRSIRLFRLFRMLKLARYSEALRTFGSVLRMKREELSVALFAILILLVVSSSLMYQAEHDAQPGAFQSIPDAMWWGIVTLTTVGYGDVYPITPLGKFIGSVVVILGIGLFALPTGILASGFVEDLNNRRHRIRCPHCGRYIDEELHGSETSEKE